MKLLVLSLCLVAVLATRTQYERQQELENALEELGDKLEDIVNAETAKKGLQYT